MCGVIGLDLKDVSESDIDSIRSLFHETQIRGRHATGVSFLKFGKITTLKEALPADEFLSLYDPLDWVDENGNISAIAHCRYSTSDLRYNQPIADSSVSIVHNGVISQELPERWEELYGINCETANDSELLFHKPDLESWGNSSISALLLNSDGIKYLKNGKRPLWIGKANTNGVVYSSTRDILKRSSFTFSSVDRVECGFGDDLQP